MTTRVLIFTAILWSVNMIEGIAFSQTWKTNNCPFGAVSVAMSADGRTLLVAAGDNQGFVSTNSGNTWLQRFPFQNPYICACSADGSHLFIGLGSLYVSTNNVPQTWFSVASSADGSKLVAVAGGYEGYGQVWPQRIGYNAQIYQC